MIAAFLARAVGRLAAFDPAFALNVGDLSRSTMLPPGRGGFALERVAELANLAAEAKTLLDRATPEERIDVMHFIHCAELESFAQVELGERLHNPDVVGPYCDWVTTTLFAPLSSEAERFERLNALVDGLPIYLAEAVTTLGEPDPLWQAIALQVAEATPPLFDVLQDAARGRATPAAAEAFRTRCDKAKAALKDFTKTLAAKKSGPRCHVLGSDRFTKLIALKRIPYDLRDLREIAEERIGRLFEKRQTLAKKLSGFSDHKNALRGLKRDHPESFDAALEEVRVLCREARDFCGERAIVELPSDEELRVIETPAYARPLVPFAAILVPKPLWPVQRSVYYMTRAGDLSELHRADLRNTVTHEAYPGHHVQFSVAHRHGSLWRNAPWTSALQAQMGVDTTEGWAHYAEALMKGQGFYTSLPDELQATNDALWRAVRIELDIGLSCGEITLEQAALRLVEEIGMHKDAALSEVRRYATMPGYNLCYAIGKHLIRELRKEAEKKPGFSMAKFHALVMTNGQAPLVVARERMRL
ncbi:MAG: DUF885 domain-containing protein [Deltaproteobacteria bacterium]|nr:DUF885 domain-containing protein [Deltaproteobacteria bacterium]